MSRLDSNSFGNPVTEDLENRIIELGGLLAADYSSRERMSDYMSLIRVYIDLQKAQGRTDAHCARGNCHE